MATSLSVGGDSGEPADLFLKSLNDVFDSGHDEVHGGGKGHGEFGREPLESVAYAFSFGFPHPNAVTSVVFE